jgi:hypothetical protein
VGCFSSIRLFINCMVLTCSHILAVHDADYRQSQKDFNSFVDSLTEKIIEKDETIPELPHKDLVRVEPGS